MFSRNNIIILFCALLFYTSNFLKAQNIDSMVKALDHEDDTLKSITYTKILKYYYSTEPLKALPYAYAAVKHAEKIGVEKYIISANNQLGITYYFLGNSTKAIEIFLNLLKIQEKNKDSLNIAKTLNNIGLTYHDAKDFEKALSYYRKSLSIKEKVKDYKTIWTTYMNIGISYNELEKFKESLDNLYKGLESWRTLKEEDKENYANIMSEIGITYLLMDSLEKAEKILIDARQALTKSGNIFRESNILKNLAEINRKKGNYALSREYLLKSIKLSKESGAFPNLPESYHAMASIEETQGNNKKALHYWRLYYDIKDSLEKITNLKEMNQLQEMYLIEKQEAEKMVLKKELELNKAMLERNRIIIIAFSIVLILVFAFSFYLIQNIKKWERANAKLNDQQKIINQSVEELKKQKEELTEANSTKDKFFSIIAHDLKNPLNSMVGLSDLLHSDFETFEINKQKRFVQLINQASNDLYKLLENLLQWSRIQTGSMPFNPTKFYLADLVQPTLSLLQASAENKNITIHNLVNKSSPVFADFSMISAVLRNLIGNALKFTNPNGNIYLEAEESDGTVKVFVRDDGVGINEGDLIKIFRADSKFSKKGTSGEKGTGLGLIVCKEFVEKNKGQIDVVSKIGEGTTFWFTLGQHKLGIN